MTSSMNKTASLIALFVVVIGAIIFFGFLPAMKNLKTNRDKMASKQSELNETYKRINVLQKSSKKPEEFAKISESVNNYWPDTLDVSHFIVQTESLAKANNLIIENFSVEQPKVAKPAPKPSSSTDSKTAPESKTVKKSTGSSSQFTFTTKSTYGSVLNLIKGMETLTRLNCVSVLNFSGNEEGSIDLRLTGSIYYGK